PGDGFTVRPDRAALVAPRRAGYTLAVKGRTVAGHATGTARPRRTIIEGVCMLHWPRRLMSLWPVLSAAVLASGATSACLLGPRLLAGSASAGAAAPASTRAEKLDVVCLGYADMEGGVAALDPAVPGQVLRVE